jgi:flagellar basal body rod protein FlgF
MISTFCYKSSIKGTAIIGNNPPITIPNAEDLRCGSRVAAIKSAIT